MNKILKNTLLTFLCCLGYMYPAIAQSGNPFEIVGREKAADLIATPAPIDSNKIAISSSGLISPTDLLDKNSVDHNESSISATPVTPSDPNNPFEIIRNSNVNISPQKEPVQKKKTVLKKENKEPGTSTNNLLFWLMTSVLIGLAFFITIYRNYLTKVYRSFFNHNILRLSYREQRSGIDIPYLILYLLFFMNLSVFIFLGLTKFYPQYVSANAGTLMQIGGGVTAIYVLKHLVLNLLDFVFQIKPEMGLYNFTIMVFNNLLGIFLIPLNFAVAFASPGLAKSLVFIGLIAILGVFVFRALRSFLLAMKLFSFHKFHFFIYLCAVELAPVIVLSKYIMLQNGIQ